MGEGGEKMSKYTKGPWEIKEVKTSCGRAFKIDKIGSNCEYGLVACIYDDNTTLNEKSHKELEANAQLIASAPDLLESCKIMTSLCRIKYGNLDKKIYKEILKAEQAIAKAENHT